MEVSSEKGALGDVVMFEVEVVSRRARPYNVIRVDTLQHARRFEDMKHGPDDIGALLDDRVAEDTFGAICEAP